MVGRKYIFIGRYDMPEEAASAFDAYVRTAVPDFARLNFPRKGEMSALEGD
jgi:hypothetical protein